MMPAVEVATISFQTLVHVSSLDFSQDGNFLAEIHTTLQRKSLP